MFFGSSRWWPRALCVVYLTIASFGATGESTSFENGSAAFERGDYAGALALFEAARAEGVDGPSVPFNIGVCQYKLGNFAAAEAEFAALAQRFPAMRALADYNRGLALLGLERRTAAADAFAAARARGDEKVASLAAAQLAALGEAAPARAGSAWQGLFEGTAGNDDNVALVDELALPPGASSESAFTEVAAYASRSWDTRVPARIDFSGYFVRYADTSEFDQDSLRVAATFTHAPGRWRLDFGPHYGRGTLDGDAFQSELGAALRADRRLGARWRFIGTIGYTDVGALVSRFDYLEGARRQARAALVRRMDRARFDASVDLEDSDRALAPVSARRERVSVGYRRDVWSEWTVGGAVSYRSSRYDRDTGPKERLTEVRLNARRGLGRDWSLAADYRRSSNDSELPIFTYDANRIAVSIGKVF